MGVGESRAKLMEWFRIVEDNVDMKHQRVTSIPLHKTHKIPWESQAHYCSLCEAVDRVNSLWRGSLNSSCIMYIGDWGFICHWKHYFELGLLLLRRNEICHSTPYWWHVDFGLGDGLVPCGNKPSPDLMLWIVYKNDGTCFIIWVAGIKIEAISACA